MLVCLIRSLILYPLLIIVIRLMGKRQLGQMEASEFVVTMLVADLASVPMQDLGIPLLSGVVPIITVLLLELTFSSLSYLSVSFRKIFCGKPVIVMENGKILQKNLQKNRLTPDELTEYLRGKDIVDLSTVKYAILETNGDMSVLLNPQDMPLTPKDAGIAVQELNLPVTIISGGKLLDHNLKLSGRGHAWVDQVLHSHSCTVSQVFLLTVDASGKTYLALKEEEG